MFQARTSSVVGIVALSAAVAALQVRAADTASEHHRMFEQCAKACSDCQRMCDHCSTHCVDMLAQGMKEHKKTLATCQDCAEVCSAAAKIVARQGPYSDLICKACADTCNKCASACDTLAQDKMMKACAAECRRCEKVCREMLKHPGHSETSVK